MTYRKTITGHSEIHKNNRNILHGP